MVSAVAGGWGWGGGWHGYRHFLQEFCLVTAGFRHEKCKLLSLSWGSIFLCDVMSNPSQNHECNILLCTESHVKKLDEIKGSKLSRIRPYLHFGHTNLTGSLGLRRQN